jgi:uncharacterized protein
MTPARGRSGDGARSGNPFQISGPVKPDEMIDRDVETRELTELLTAGHSVRLVAPRRYGKTSLLGRVLRDAAREGMATAHVDLLGVLTLAGIVTRIERAYAESLRGAVRKAADAILRSWNVGVSLGGGGFAVTFRSNPSVDVESVLLRLLELPSRLAARTGKRCVIAFDEMQDVLRVDGADGIVRSVIQYQVDDASYLFAGSSPSLMSRLFDSPSRPLLDHALPVELGPLPPADAAVYLGQRFERTGREPGSALDPLLLFVRGHPQRTMLLAHHLWAVTPRGSTSDESAWAEALDRAARGSRAVLQARWQALPANEQRVAVALATGVGSVYDAAVYRSVGLKRGSIDRALAGLEGRGEAIRGAAGWELADPLLERWLAERGIF